MYEIIKQVILSGDYELSDMLNKIKKNCVRGDITDEQETELIALAREHATPENSYAGIQSQVDYIRHGHRLKTGRGSNQKSSRRGRDRYSRTGAGTRTGQVPGI